MLQSMHYRINLVQELSDENHGWKVRFCKWTLDNLEQDRNIFWNVCFSDEATFNNNGCVNIHNCHYWSLINPHWSQQVLNQFYWSLHVWIGILNDQIIGPHLFEEFINGAIYLDCLRNLLSIYLQDVLLTVRFWFQQDSAPAHFARDIRTFLNAEYSNRWIGREGQVSWFPRSPDLNPLDYFLWGCVKNSVHENKSITRIDMMNRIRRVLEVITPETIYTIIQNFRRRLNCVWLITEDILNIYLLILP